MQTPRGNRLHIGIFGRRNAGKSSLINALTGQDTAIVSSEAGTTADPVFKAMELHPIGPVVFIDTAGFDDEGQTGERRVERAQSVIDRTDIAILVMDGERLGTGSRGTTVIGDTSDGRIGANGTVETGAAGLEIGGTGWTDLAGGETGGTAENDATGVDTDALEAEKEWLRQLKAREIPIVLVINKWEALHNRQQRMALAAAGKLHGIAGNGINLIPTSTVTGEGVEELRNELKSMAPKFTDDNEILKALLPEGETVLLVMPQDIQAPKGRLILPQVQTIRALLDRKCTVVSSTADGLGQALGELSRSPELIITDSQCFGRVWDEKPEESRLTSFSILMAQVKGDIEVFVDSAKAIDDLADTFGRKEPSDRNDDRAVPRILIAEACTHVPQGEDIGTVKIPGLLRNLFGGSVEIINVRGDDFPTVEELKSYDLVIHCGACMFNRRHVMSRIALAAEAGVPITNYGVFLAKMNGILDRIEI